MKSFSVRGEVKMISIEPVIQKPDNATIGGFSVVDKNDTVINFDWLEHRGNADITPEGLLELEWDLVEFDEEFFISSNEEEGIQEADWSLITDSTLEEVYYEALINPDLNDENYEEKGIQMNLVSFSIFVYAEGSNHRTEFKFNQEQINAYNALTSTDSVATV